MALDETQEVDLAPRAATILLSPRLDIMIMIRLVGLSVTHKMNACICFFHSSQLFEIEMAQQPQLSSGVPHVMGIKLTKQPQVAASSTAHLIRKEFGPTVSKRECV